MDYTRFHTIESALIFLCRIWRTIKHFSVFTLKHDVAKNSIRTCRIEHPLNMDLLFSLKFELSPTFVTVTEVITVPFGETNHTSCVLYFFYSTS